MANDNSLLLEAKGSVGNTAEFTFWRDELQIDVDNPWAGSTETGFGYTCHASLSVEQALALRDWLTAVLFREKVQPE